MSQQPTLCNSLSLIQSKSENNDKLELLIQPSLTLSYFNIFNLAFFSLAAR